MYDRGRFSPADNHSFFERQDQNADVTLWRRVLIYKR